MDDTSADLTNPAPRAQSDDISPLDVIVVMYRSSDVIYACLRSLLEQHSDIGRIVLIDNCCPAKSAEAAKAAAIQLGFQVREVSISSPPSTSPCVELIRSNRNLGFAGGVNLGLKLLLQDVRSQYIWVLNPDCELTPGCAATLVEAARQAELTGGFSLLGSRITYHGEAGTIQSDGGICSAWTGRCSNRNQGKRPADVSAPTGERVDFVSGASMIASRKFIERAGLMPEHYFLYFEEVAWAHARADVPLVMCRDAIVQHHGGTAIGSGAHDRLPSPMSNYFNFRNRLWFIASHHPLSLPVSYGFSLLKILQTVAKGGWSSAVAAFRGLHGLPPSAKVRAAFSEEEQRTIFRQPNKRQTAINRQDRKRPA